MCTHTIIQYLLLRTATYVKQQLLRRHDTRQLGTNSIMGGPRATRSFETHHHQRTRRLSLRSQRQGRREITRAGIRTATDTSQHCRLTGFRSSHLKDRSPRRFSHNKVLHAVLDTEDLTRHYGSHHFNSFRIC